MKLPTLSSQPTAVAAAPSLLNVDASGPEASAFGSHFKRRSKRIGLEGRVTLWCRIDQSCKSMKTQIYQRFESRLPTNDTHLYRTGPWRPQSVEYDAWRFNLVTGETREEVVTDRVMEFGMINGRFGGRRYRYSYSALPAEGWFGFRGIVKYDHQLGIEQVVTLPDGVFASETVMAPRDGSAAEDDGYLITYTIDKNQDRSECLVLDAANSLSEPIARISLPERISCGTHSCWAPLEALLR